MEGNKHKESVSRGLNKDGEIDLLELVRKVWAQRKLVLATAGVCMLLGITVAYVSPKKYTARCVMVPQTGEQSIGNLGGLAAIAGINLGGMASGNELTPELYPKIIASVPFQKELMLAEADFEKEGRTTLIDYFNTPAPEGKEPVSTPVVEGTEELSGAEAVAMGALAKVITLDDDDHLLTLSATMREPVAAAQIAVATQRLLQKYITQFRTQKTQATLDFVEARTQEAQEELDSKQQIYADFRDSNRNVVTQMGIARSKQLQMEMELASNIYSELASQREQLRITVKEQTPVFTVIEPVTVPMGPSAPRRKLIIAGFTIIGLAIGAVWAVFRKG